MIYKSEITEDLTMHESDAFETGNYNTKWTKKTSIFGIKFQRSYKRNVWSDR